MVAALARAEAVAAEQPGRANGRFGVTRRVEAPPVFDSAAICARKCSPLSSSKTQKAGPDRHVAEGSAIGEDNLR